MVAASQLVSEVIVKDSASAAADRVTSALDRLTAAEGKTTDGAASSSRALESSAKQFERLRAAADPAYAAQQRFATQQQQIARAVQLGTATEIEAAAVTKQLQAQLVGGTGAFGKYGQAIQNSSFQVADFATQVAGGTSPIRALAQQLPQLLGGFGVLGAVLSAAVAIGGAFAQNLLTAKDKTDDAATAQQKWNDLLDKAKQTAGDLHKEIAATSDALSASLRNLAGIAKISSDAAQAALAATPKQVGSGGLLAQGFGAKADNPAYKEKADAAAQAQANALAAAAYAGQFDDRFSGLTRGGDVYKDNTKAIQDLIAAQQRELDLLKQSDQQRTVSAQVDRELASLDLTRVSASRDLVDQLTTLATAQYQQGKANQDSADKARQATQALKDNQQAASDFARSLQALQDRLNPIGAAQRSLDQDVVTLDIALDQGRITIQQYDAALDQLYKDAQAKLDPTGAAIDKLRASQGAQLATIQAQTATLDEATGARDRYLAGLQAEQQLTSQNIPLSDARSKAYIEQAQNIAAANDELKRQQGIVQELPNFFDQAFDRIGSAITQATATGEISFASLLDVGKAVVSELEQEFLKLALVNPLKNLSNGDSALPTLGDIGGKIVDWIFGSGSGGTGVGSVNTSTGMLGHAAGGGYVQVGENGPERFYPGVSGTVYPTGKAPAGDVQVQLINQTGTNATATASTSTGADGKMLIKVLLKEAVRDVNNNGDLGQAIGKRFGASPVAQVQRG